MQILLTNDDGIYAPGLAAMEQALKKLGDVCVVAPAVEQSGVGHSITFLSPLMAKEVFDGDRRRGFAVEGSPADCVKLALSEFCPRRPELIVSGINGGLNLGINVLYSGTVAAAATQKPAEKPRTEAGRAPIGEGGYLTAIAGARRHVLNRVQDLAWTQGVQHFQATEGRLPKDHDEFIKKIVEELGIDLGFKEEGQEFLYDPTPNEDHPWGTVYVVEAEAQSAQ